MKLFRRLISLDEALKTVLTYAKGRETGVEEVAFEEALNRVLAEDVRSPVDSPPFDRAAMDGYAIRGEDSFGASPSSPVFLSEYFPIQTGQPMPADGRSNAVVMLEFAKESEVGDGGGEKLEIFKPVTPGRNVSLKGEDVKKGEVVLKAGRRLLRAHDIGMLASVFKRTVRVRKKAKVGIISTGDELSDPKQPRNENKIADANSFVLTALTQKIASPRRLGIARDDRVEIKDAIKQGLEECDGLLVSGGSSVGRRDFLADAVTDLGELVFHGVAIRPGEPTGFGVVDEKPVFVLPGFPVATISAFELLVRPFLNATHGLEAEGERRKIFATAAKKIPSAVGRTDFVRVRLFCAENEKRCYAEPVRVSGSGILSSVTKSDGFVLVEENSEGVEAGGKVGVNLWE